MKLSKAQWNVLKELAEPNTNPENEWRVPGRWTRSIDGSSGLMNRGLVKVHERYPFMICSITDAGRAALKETEQ